MEIRSRTFRHASRNTFAFDQTAHDETVAQEMAKGRIEDASAHVHTAAGCMSRDKDTRVITVYYGARDIAGNEYVITDDFEDAASVEQPSAIEEGRRIGREVIRARLVALRAHRAALEMGENASEIAIIDLEAQELRGMLA